jgi:V8-like Glu-specific endopeptidase
MYKICAVLLGTTLAIFSLFASKPDVDSSHQKAEHLVQFLDKDGAPVSSCTALAIGPAAFMTASHCNDGTTPNDEVYLDLSTHKFHLAEVTSDGRDHSIYLMSEAPFKNVVNVDPGEHPAAPGEDVYIYGCGGRDYPCQLRKGVELERDTTSDVDQMQGMAVYSIEVIPGDSGSAIFGSDGRVIALVTYRIEVRKKHWYGTTVAAVHCGAFDLNFSKEQLDIAKAFNSGSI